MAWRTALLGGLTNDLMLMLPLLLASAVTAITAAWLFPLLATERGTCRGALETAFLLGLRELGRSLAVLAVEAAAAALGLWCLSASLTAAGLWVLFGAAPAAWLTHRMMAAALRTA